MNDERKSGSGKTPKTLADFIPAEEPDRPERRDLSRKDRERLSSIERAVRETEPEAVRRSRKAPKSRPRQKRRKNSSARFIFWAIAILLLFVLFS